MSTIARPRPATIAIDLAIHPLLESIRNADVDDVVEIRNEIASAMPSWVDVFEKAIAAGAGAKEAAGRIEDARLTSALAHFRFITMMREPVAVVSPSCPALEWACALPNAEILEFDPDRPMLGIRDFQRVLAAGTFVAPAWRKNGTLLVPARLVPALEARCGLPGPQPLVLLKVSTHYLSVPLAPFPGHLAVAEY